MTERDIQEIVEEVIRRIRLNSEKKKILAVVNSPSDACAIDTYLGDMEKSYQVTERYADGGKGSEGLGNCDLQALMSEHCALILSGVTLKQLIRIQDLQLDDPVAELAAEALRIGKPVTVLSKWIDTAGGTPAFAGRIDEIKKTLNAYGVTFASENKTEKDRTISGKDEGADCRSEKHRIDKRVIAKQDLKHVLQGELEIRDDAVMTTTAKDLLEKRGIRITRYQG